VRQALADAGVTSDRITFVGYQPRNEYLATYRRIDIGLDTLPYNGHTTSLEAFWMGVPVITLVGATVVGRAGLSFCENLGLRELVAHAAESYVETAAALAQDLPRLVGLRRCLRERLLASPLCDTARFTGDLEVAYRTLWRVHCERATRGN
jgi:predicted O-linked N-acetylglucosamine transferase (SPINDLY family)